MLSPYPKHWLVFSWVGVPVELGTSGGITDQLESFKSIHQSVCQIGVSAELDTGRSIWMGRCVG